MSKIKKYGVLAILISLSTFGFDVYISNKIHNDANSWNKLQSNIAKLKDLEILCRNDVFSNKNECQHISLKILNLESKKDELMLLQYMIKYNSKTVKCNKTT